MEQKFSRNEKTFVKYIAKMKVLPVLILGFALVFSTILNLAVPAAAQGIVGFPPYVLWVSVESEGGG